MDRKATYTIKIPGLFYQDEGYWGDELIIKSEVNSDGFQTTTLTTIADQAALHGILRRLYSLNIPLISVVCVNWI